MRIVALGKAPNNPSGRYRIEAYRPFLEWDGHGLESHIWPQSLLDRLRLQRQIGAADVVILQRRMLSTAQLWMLRRQARSLIFDFDDALFLRDSFAANGPHCPRRARKFRATVQSAEWIVAGNRFLFEHAELTARPERIFLVPTCVDTTRYPLARHDRAEKIQLVWIGSSSTAKGLEPIRGWLEMLSHRQPGIVFKVICDNFPSFQSLKVIEQAWDQKTESQELAGADIGISWLPDDLWSRGKCGLKVLQYMAAGLPVVANPVGVHTELVRHEKTGFLVETPGEFCEAVRTLSGDPELRRRFGWAGRRIVEQSYDISVGAAKWREILSLVARSRQQKMMSLKETDDP